MRTDATYKISLLVCLIFISILLFLWDVSTGSIDINFLHVIQILLLQGGNDMNSLVVNEIRVPVALMAITVGGSLSLSGCLLQTILNNPLASPFSLGISAAAGFGAALSIVYGTLIPEFIKPSFVTAISAFFFAFLSCSLIYLVSSLTQGKTITIILVGIAIFFAFQALLSAIQYFATPEESQHITFWLFGSLSKSDYTKIGIVSLVLACCILYSLKNSWVLTALRLGDDGAAAVGVNIKKTRLKFFFITSLLTGASIAFVGIIGFIGIVAPHIARMLVGEDHRFLMPCSVLIGGNLLAVASVVSKIIVPGVIFPVGIITAIFGVPFFIILILWKRNQTWN